MGKGGKEGNHAQSQRRKKQDQGNQAKEPLSLVEDNNAQDTGRKLMPSDHPRVSVLNPR